MRISKLFLGLMMTFGLLSGTTIVSFAQSISQVTANAGTDNISIVSVKKSKKNKKQMTFKNQIEN